MKNTIIICKDCKEESLLKGLNRCASCYIKHWKKYVRKKRICPECKRLRFHHSKGLCNVCYNKIHRYDKNLLSSRVYGVKKYFKLSLDDYHKLVEKCLICGFNKIVCLHHIDKNKKNNHKDNFIGLCPNHHFMAHNKKYKAELDILIKSVREKS